VRKERVVFLILALLLVISFDSKQVLASSYGYTQKIKTERESKYEEITIFVPQYVLTHENLNDKLFNFELSKEIKSKYILQFGTVDTDAFIYKDSRYAEMSDDNRRGIVAEKASIDAREAFAQYMVKRLTEFHLDRFIKEDPKMRHVYEVKEKISNVKVEINKETKFNLQYSLAGNTLDFNLTNPYLDSRYISYMNPSNFGPTSPIENRLLLGKQIYPQLRINLYAAEFDGIITGEIVRNFKYNVTGSFVSSTWFKTGGMSPRETRTAVNVSSSF
jgi:hypothetical protein